MDDFSRKRPIAVRSRQAVLDATISILLIEPGVTMSEIADRIGIGRTTLYRMFPSKEEMVREAALDSISRITDALSASSIDYVFGEDSPDIESDRAITSLVELLVPMGPRLMFLLRLPHHDLDEEIERGAFLIDSTLKKAISRGQSTGRFRTDFSSKWILDCLYSTLYVACLGVDSGDLAPNGAATLVIATWLHGSASSR